nr:DUF6241 domain-containing protein [Paenibacillus bovis]
MAQVEAREEFKEQTKYMGGEVTLSISEVSDEDSIMEDMHKMTHQKVKSDEKWGAIEMSQANIDELIEILKLKQFEGVDRLKEIAMEWKAGDFSKVVNHHNHIWRKQGGTIGVAYGIMSPEEEAEFCYTTIHNKRRM